MTIGNGGLTGLGEGTRLTKKLDTKEELWSKVKAALVMVVCVDVVLTVILLTAIKTGWWALPILGIVFGYLAGWFGMAAADRFDILLKKWEEGVLVFLWAICGFLGLAVGYLGRIKVDPMIRLLNRQIWAAFDLEWWWFALGAAVLVVVGIKTKSGRLVIITLGVLVVTVLALGADWDAYGRIWSVASWILVVYTWPVTWPAVLLARAMSKEIRLPNLEITMKPIELRELQELGNLGLSAPRLFAPTEYEEELSNKPETMDINLWELADSGNGKRQKMGQTSDLMTDERARQFYRAVTSDPPIVTFSENGASNYHIGPETFRQYIRDPLMGRGLASWSDEDNHNQGIDLSDQAWITLEHLGRSTPLPRERA